MRPFLFLIAMAGTETIALQSGGEIGDAARTFGGPSLFVTIHCPPFRTIKGVPSDSGTMMCRNNEARNYS